MTAALAKMLIAELQLLTFRAKESNAQQINA